jgi:hypothetical protein
VTTPRSCPNCGAEETRWIIAGREYVNLSPLTDQCVDCLAAMSKEMGPPVEGTLDFDPKSAAANDKGEV